MYIPANTLITPPDHQSSVVAADPEHIKAYLTSNVYAGAEPVYTIDCPIVNLSAALQQQEFAKQLLALLGHQTEDLTVKGSFVELAENLEVTIDTSMVHPANKLFSRLMEYPELMFADCNTSKEAQAKKSLANLKQNLEIVYFLAATRAVGFKHETARILHILFSQMGVCLPGLESTLLVLIADLQNKDLAAQLASFRFELIQDYKCILQAKFAEQGETHLANNDIHLLNNMVKFAHQHGFKVNSTINIQEVDDLLASTLALPEEEEMPFMNYLTKNYTLGNFVRWTISIMMRSIKDAASALSTRLDEDNAFSYYHLPQMETLILSKLKSLNFVDAGVTEIPAKILKFDGYTYDYLANFSIHFATNEDETDAEICVMPYSSGEEYVWVKISTMEQICEYEVDLPRVIVEKYRNEPSNLLAEIAKRTTMVSLENLEYFLIKRLYEQKMCSADFIALASFGEKKLQVVRYDDELYASAIYIEPKGRLKELFKQSESEDDDDDSMVQILKNSGSSDVVQVVLNYAAVHGNTGPLTEIIAANIEIDPWCLELLCYIALTYKRKAFVAHLLQIGIDLEFSDYKQHLKTLTSLSLTSDCNNIEKDILLKMLDLDSKRIFELLLCNQSFTRSKLIFLLENANQIQLKMLFSIMLEKKHDTRFDIFADDIDLVPPRLSLLNVIFSLDFDHELFALYLRLDQHAIDYINQYLKKQNVWLRCPEFLEFLLENLAEFPQIRKVNFSGDANSGFTALASVCSKRKPNTLQVLQLLALGADPYMAIMKDQSILDSSKIDQDMKFLLRNPLPSMFKMYAESTKNNFMWQVLIDLLQQDRYRSSLYPELATINADLFHELIKAGVISRELISRAEVDVNLEYLPGCTILKRFTELVNRDCPQEMDILNACNEALTKNDSSFLGFSFQSPSPAPGTPKRERESEGPTPGTPKLARLV